MKLEIKSVSKAYGKQPILKQLSLHIPEGNVAALIGPSGVGKSTLLKILAGLEIPDEGEIFLDGEKQLFDEKSLISHRKEIGMVFQMFNLFPHLTALDNITLPLKIVYGMDEESAQEKAFTLLKRFSLEHCAYKKPAHLSGGQNQRVAIIRATAVPRKLLLLDEPTSALDPIMTAEVYDLISELDSPILIASHHMGFIRKSAQWVAYVNEGRVIEVAPTAQFFQNPQQAETKAFLKTMMKYF